VNIDERLDRLAERHEALEQSTELLHASLRELREIATAHDGYMSTLMSAATKLLETATNHERRLTRLEGQSPSA
jgi:prefoldin subunit 5